MEEFIKNITDNFSSPLNSVLSIADIFITVAVVYLVAAFLKRNNAARVIKYIAALVVLGVIFSGLTIPMPITSRLFSQFMLLTVIIIFTLFPQEIKRALWKIASPKDAVMSYTTKYNCSDEKLKSVISDIVRAVQNMSKKDVGALIIIAPDNLPENIIDSGTRLNAELSCSLIECLFNTKAPLHDGAVYIRGDKIVAAGCFLPLTQKTDLDKELGTRHRAAIGITEQYAHLAIIVSEETGIISVAKNGEISRYYDTEMLSDELMQIYGLKATAQKSKKHKKMFDKQA